MFLTQSFQYRDRELHCEEVPLARIADRVGTPCYVYSSSAILGNFRTFRHVFEEVDPLVCYALKANSNLSILKLLKVEGSGFDVVSGGELFRLKKIGADPKKIVFSGVGKTVEELNLAVKMELLSLNLESTEELETLIALTTDSTRPVDISLRINPDVDPSTHPYIATGLRDSKFGIELNRLARATSLLRQAPNIQLKGLGFHIGSQIMDVKPFMEAFLHLKRVADELREEGFDIRHLDLGGGIGIPYQEEHEPDLTGYARFLAQNRGEYRLLFEPGRFVVGNAGVLINKVLYHKVSTGKNFLIVDGAMNDLIRPSLYQAYHAVQPLTEKEATIMADVVGPVCESGDFFATDRLLPELHSGDYLAVMNAGAYGFVAASNYNSRPRAAEVLVEGSQFRTIREREGLEDLVRGE